MSGVISAVKSVMLDGASQEWTVWPAVLSPVKRVKFTPEISSMGREVLTTPQGSVSVPRGHGSPYAPIQIIISYLESTVLVLLPATDLSGSINMS